MQTPPPPAVARAASEAAPEPAALRERRVRDASDRNTDLLWSLIFAVGFEQLRQACESGPVPDGGSRWTWWTLDLALGMVVRGLMNALTNRVCMRHHPAPAAQGAQAPQVMHQPPASALPAMRDTRPRARIQPVASAISKGEATWAIACLSHGALALPATESEVDLAAFS